MTAESSGTWQPADEPTVYFCAEDLCQLSIADPFDLGYLDFLRLAAVEQAQDAEVMGNWKAAEAEPNTLSALLDKEISNGWVVRTKDVHRTG